jgi:hypothetical protein
VTYSTSGPAAPGWYPTTPGSSQVRWWDGAQWTEHYQTLGLAPEGLGTAPAGTNPNTVWIWIFSLVPLLEFLVLPLIVSYYRVIFSGNLSDTTFVLQREFGSSSGALAANGIGLLIDGVFVVFAALDYRALKARGVPRPFHWAWAFLSAVVYIIGRTVVVRRRTGGGLAPLWIFIAAFVAYFVVSLAVLLPIAEAAVSSSVQ